MIPVAEALDRLFALAPVTDVGTVPLLQAAGRVLARDVRARITQPPFAASAMDGYAVIGSEAKPGATFAVIGEAAAGHAFDGAVAAGQAVRIFTGAPLPAGADRVIIQEDVRRKEARITLTETLDAGPHVRPKGADFKTGDRLVAPRVLGAADVALLAAMNIPEVPVYRRPDVAILATGDELVQPGETPASDQIIASNSFGLAAQITAAGGLPRLLPIARDTRESLALAFDLARGADLILTIGGASVGDHDLVGKIAGELGMERSFYKVAMRPGKPLMAGEIEGTMMIGLPGNPVSAMVCGTVFVAPVLRAMQGLPAAPAFRRTVRLSASVEANGPREHYMRAEIGPDGVRAFTRQDSALLTVLSSADCLLVRPPNDPSRKAGDLVEIITI